MDIDAKLKPYVEAQAKTLIARACHGEVLTLDDFLRATIKALINFAFDDAVRGVANNHPHGLMGEAQKQQRRARYLRSYRRRGERMRRSC